MTGLPLDVYGWSGPEIDRLVDLYRNNVIVHRIIKSDKGRFSVDRILFEIVCILCRRIESLENEFIEYKLNHPPVKQSTS
jgi:hypothetical protein